MSDFLSRLAERALGATPPLQPLVGSRFAVPSEPADGFVEETVEAEGSAPTVRRSTDTAAAPPRPAAEGPSSAGPPSPVHVPTPAPESRTPPPAASRPQSLDRAAQEGPLVASSARPFAHHDDARPAREVAPSARAAEPSPSRVRASSGVPAAPPEGSLRGGPRAETERVQDDELLIPASTPPDPPAVESTASTREDGSAPLPAVEARRRGAGDSPDATQPARDGEHASEALLMPAARGAEARAVDGDSGDARQPWAERMPAAPVQKERPVVQVTIGRIEVRAVHPPAAPESARGAGWSPPVLSLDEYLKRGGGR